MLLCRFVPEDESVRRRFENTLIEERARLKVLFIIDPLQFSLVWCVGAMHSSTQQFRRSLMNDMSVMLQRFK